MSSSGRSFLSHPKKAIFLILLIAVALVASVYAYLEFFSPSAGPRVSIISYPLELSMELNKTKFQQGEDITIRLSLKNIGNETIVVYWGDFYGYMDAVMYFDFYIMDANNTQVYQWTRDHAGLPSVLEETLNPDEQLVSVYIWNQKTRYPHRTQVPKGTYTVKGFSRIMGLIVQDQTSVITLETPTITFTIK